jgi:hypothetical protein
MENLSNKLLIKFSDNWADEMDVNGWVILDSQKWVKIKEKVEAYNDYFSIGFGSNQENEYENGEDFLEAINIRLLSENEFIVLTSCFGSRYGNTSFYDQILDLEPNEE